MTFDTTEKSIQDGRPRELYTFELFGGTYRRTSSKEDETYGGILYRATPGLSRGNVVEVPLGEKRDPTVTLPVTDEIAAALLANGIPPKRATVTIVRFHDASDTAYRVWLGGIVEISTDDQYARLRVPSLIELAFDVKVPLLKASRVCQHALYGPGCQAVRGGGVTNLIAVDGVNLTVNISDPDGFANGGEIVRIADGEPRTILTQVGQDIVIDVPFKTMAPGDSVALVAGCDGLPVTCRDKFDNMVNFGGHPDLPEQNPTSLMSPRGRAWIWDALKTGS